MQQGKAAIERLLDPALKLTPHSSNQIARMVQAAAACINFEESRRPSIDEVIAIMRGEEAILPTRRKSTFPGNVVDCYPHLQQSKSDIRSHLALAMLGVSELEDDDHFYCR